MYYFISIFVLNLFWLCVSEEIKLTTEGTSTPSTNNNSTLTWGFTNNTKLSLIYRKNVANDVNSSTCRQLCLYESTCAAYWYNSEKNGNGTCYTTKWPLHKSRVKDTNNKVFFKIQSGISWTKLDIIGLKIKYRYSYRHGYTDLPQCLQICELDYSCTLVYFSSDNYCMTSYHKPALDALKVGKGAVNIVLVGTVSKVVAVGIGAVILTPASVLASAVVVGLIDSIGDVVADIAVDSILPNSAASPAGIYIKDVPQLSEEELNTIRDDVELTFNNVGLLVESQESPSNETLLLKSELKTNCTPDDSNLQCGFEIYENQRWWVMSGWAEPSVVDPYPFSDITGKIHRLKDKWKSEWQITAFNETDAEGWRYSRDFRLFSWSPNSTRSRYVRRRRWVRLCEQE